jgi:hypothetical protein
MMKHLWFSTGVLNKAYRETLEDCNSPMGLDDGSGYISVVNGTFAEVVYSVGVSEIGGKEKEILAAAVENLKSVLSQMQDEGFSKLLKQLNQTHQQCEAAEVQVAGMQKQVRAITEQGVTNRQELQKKIGDLQDSRVDIDMRVRYSEARIKQLNEQKDQLRAAVTNACNNDGVRSELVSVVYEADKLVLQCEEGFKSGGIPAEKVQEAKEKLARARIELAKREEEVREKAGQNQLRDINNKISDQYSQLSEFAIAEKFKENSRAETERRLKESDELELLQMKLDAAKKSFQEMLDARETLKNRLDTAQKLSITVIGDGECLRDLKGSAPDNTKTLRRRNGINETLEKN